jgi:hypothetical protein
MAPAQLWRARSITLWDIKVGRHRMADIAFVAFALR